MLMTEIDIEANGIILVDTEVLHRVLEWRPRVGEKRDLLYDFFNSELGESVIEHGAITPLLSIDDGGYELICRYDHEPSTVSHLIATRNGEFPLVVEQEALFFDLDALIDWPPSEAGILSMLAPGNYAVTIHGFRDINEGRITRAGYEFVARPTKDIIKSTAPIDAYMRVFM